MRKFVSESMHLRQESTLTLIFYSNQTILEFCENWFDDQSTLTMIFQATPGATSSNKTALERVRDT